MKRILVTGGAGYIGSHTVIELVDSGFEVVIVDNLSNSKASVINRINQITSKKIKFIEADVSDRAKVEEIFKEFHINTVIHFAGFNNENFQSKIRNYISSITVE